MSAKSQIEEIKSGEYASEQDRIWAEIDKLAEMVDLAPEAGARLAGQKLGRAMRG